MSENEHGEGTTVWHRSKGARIRFGGRELTRERALMPDRPEPRRLTPQTLPRRGRKSVGVPVVYAKERDPIMPSGAWTRYDKRTLPDGAKAKRRRGRLQSRSMVQTPQDATARWIAKSEAEAVRHVAPNVGARAAKALRFGQHVEPQADSWHRSPGAEKKFGQPSPRRPGALSARPKTRVRIVTPPRAILE